MRIITGKHRGRKLIECKDFRSLRPTSDKNRENLFNVLLSSQKIRQLGFEITECSFLDVFCGSGAVALEAMSRGAKSASLIDNDRTHLNLANANAKLLGENNLQYFCVDATKPIFKNREQHNLIFIDPPYYKNLAAIAVKNLLDAGWIADNALIIIEHFLDENLEQIEPKLELLEQRKYKETIFSFYQNKPCF